MFFFGVCGWEIEADGVGVVAVGGLEFGYYLVVGADDGEGFQHIVGYLAGHFGPLVIYGHTVEARGGVFPAVGAHDGFVAAGGCVEGYLALDAGFFGFDFFFGFAGG